MISARPITNGGVIIGNTDNRLINRRAGSFERVTRITNASASSVAARAVINPSWIVFQTMPPTPQMLLLATRAASADGEKCPDASTNAFANIRASG